jgi:hypothetical protein
MPAPSQAPELWLTRQFNQIDEANALTHSKLDKLIAMLQGSPNALVTPELEKVVKRVAARAQAIDLKVPDEETK